MISIYDFRCYDLAFMKHLGGCKGPPFELDTKSSMGILELRCYTESL